MSVRRALVDCAVLSLKDPCVFYPFCQSCFSRIDVQADTARCRCSRCGYRCLTEQVEYRYRLSLQVTRNCHIFGVTVFGGCLNPFFGTPASSLQRLTKDSVHNQNLLAKAVEDCFIGRHFVFGIKLADSDLPASLLFSGGLPCQASSGGTDHFIATQITLSCAATPGCSVVSYYQSLLKQTAGSTDLGAARMPPLLLQPSTPISLLEPTPPSCLRSPSQLEDHAPTPMLPWQQSMGVVTSSAEQDGDCSSEGNGGHESCSFGRNGGDGDCSFVGNGGDGSCSLVGNKGDEGCSFVGDGGDGGCSLVGHGGNGDCSFVGNGGYGQCSFVENGGDG